MVKAVFGSVGAVVAVIVGILLVGLVVVYVFGTFQRETADFRGKTSAIEKLKADGDYRITVYNQFFDTCAGIQTNEAQINALQEELDAGVSAARKDQITASITALRSVRAEKINQYNADASKDFTNGAFRDLDLPWHLDINDKETECAR